MQNFLIGLLVVCVILLILAELIVETRVGKGFIGEMKVHHVLKSFSDKYANTHVIHNYCVSDFNGNSHQIDNILISTKGIFVIETKNYSGNVYGNYKSKNWYQYLHGKRYEFYSPIKQNQTHVDVLKELIGSNYFYYNTVVFINTNVKNVTADNVMTVNKLSDFINSKNEVYTNETVEIIYNEFINVYNARKVSNRKHIKNVNERLGQK